MTDPAPARDHDLELDLSQLRAAAPARYARLIDLLLDALDTLAAPDEAELP